jgi:hypothetical protein
MSSGVPSGAGMLTRRILILSIFVALTAPLPAQQARESNVQIKDGVKVYAPIRHPGATSPSFTLSIRGGDDAGTRYEFRVGSIVAITISMTNITNHDIDYSSHFWHLNSSYNYLVWDEDGKPAEKISFGDPDLSTSSQYWSGISPGKTEIYEADLEQIYKFDRPGRYTVQVSRPDDDYLDENGKPVVIKSNTITITIIG